MSESYSRGIIIAGPSASGKTTAGELLAEKLQCPFIEGDSLHSPQNIAKMSVGEPLTDDDRWDWLRKVAQNVSTQALGKGVAVASCSALARRYRDFLQKESTMPLTIVFLSVSPQELEHRISNRLSHYMKANMLASQLAILEPPSPEELVENGGNCKLIVVDKMHPDEVCKKVLESCGTKQSVK